MSSCWFYPRITQQSGDASEPRCSRASYDLTVFKIKWGNLTLKIYDKGGRVLRMEVVVYNAKELRSGKMLEKLPALLERMRDMLVRFLGTIQAAHVYTFWHYLRSSEMRACASTICC
jgi:hypothetical protein